jgi:two-component system LytT family response regulator
MINAIAIDDEPPALSVLETFCSKTDFIQLQKTFTSTQEAQRHLRKFPVDLLFLDINMPSISGIELYKSLEQNTMVIFTTAYGEYALEGFHLNATDYLLKPYSFERFQQAVEKVKKQVATYKNENERVLFIRADYNLNKINLDDILYVEGLNDYVKIHLKNQKNVVARMTMKGFMEKLPGNEFIRVHRSFIVPLKSINRIRNKIIYLENSEVPIGTSYEKDFFARFTEPK